MNNYSDEPMIQWFTYSHLSEPMRGISMSFSNMAYEIIDRIPRSAERTVALRKLLESKDAAVRAVVPNWTNDV